MGMKLIADSGSTKTDWCVLSGGNVVDRVETQGINPFMQDAYTIGNIIKNEFVPKTLVCANEIDAVYFYGAGCQKNKIPIMENIVKEVFPNAIIEVCSDLIAAARSLFLDEAGIACILGTGSNSCLYDGKKIVDTVPPLGYILGDEGSGAVLGKLFINAIFKGDLSSDIRDMFLKETGYTYIEIVNKVYREPLANRFLASISTFINKHKTEYQELSDLVVDNFSSFFSKNIAKYGKKELKIGVIGSIGYYYKDELLHAATMAGYSIGRVAKSPMNGLLRYHSI